MVAPLSQLLSLWFGALIWLCPFWINPTPSVVPLLWGGACLALWALGLPSAERISAATNPASHASRASISFNALLCGLGLLIAWRSHNAPNALAAIICLAAIWLASLIPQSLASAAPGTWDVRRATRLIAGGWLIAALVNAVLALCQYTGLTNEPQGTAFGFLRQRNQMATLCSIGLLSLLYLASTVQTTNTADATPDSNANANANAHAHSWRYQLAWHAAAWMLSTALAVTASRVGVLQLGLVVLAGLCVRRWRALTVSALTAYVLAAWAMPLLTAYPETVLARLMGTTQGLALQDSRRLLWDNTLDLIRLQPWLGVGWRELAHSLVMTDFAPSARFAAQADHTHNLPLQLAVELGVPAAALWLAALTAWVLWQRPWRSVTDASLMAWGVLAVIGIHSLLEYPLWYAPFQIATGLAVGIVMLHRAEGHQVTRLTGTSARSARSGRSGRGVALGLLLFCAYAAFDYFRVAQIFKPAKDRVSFYREYTITTAEGTWLFAAQVRYAKLTTTPVTPENAQAIYALAQQVLHFSPEPSVLKIAIQAAELLTQDPSQADPAVVQALVRYRHQLSLIEPPTSKQ